jgi:ABC-2 type transport system permease protein
MKRTFAIMPILGLLEREVALWIRDWKSIPLRFFLQPSVQIFVFASVLGDNFHNNVDKIKYSSIVGPGIVVMVVINFCILNVSNNIMIGYTTRLFETWLGAPISVNNLLLYLVFSATLNGILSGSIVIILLYIIVGVYPDHLIEALCAIMVTSTWTSIMACAVFLIPKTPDKLQGILPYFLIPATYLGCTFYRFSDLSVFWRAVSLLFPTTWFCEFLRDAYNINSGIGSAWFIFGALIMSLIACGAFLLEIGRRRLNNYLW